MTLDSGQNGGCHRCAALCCGHFVYIFTVSAGEKEEEI